LVIFTYHCMLFSPPPPPPPPPVLFWLPDPIDCFPPFAISPKFSAKGMNEVNLFREHPTPILPPLLLHHLPQDSGNSVIFLFLQRKSEPGSPFSVLLSRQGTCRLILGGAGRVASLFEVHLQVLTARRPRQAMTTALVRPKF